MSRDKILLILESPAKAKTVESYLGSQYIVRSSYGHLFDLASGGRFGIGVDLEKNFELKFRLMPDKKDKLQAIIDCTGGVKEIILATDPDREGEGIAADLARSLISTGLPIKRATFSEITKKGVAEGMANIREIDAHLVEAQHARRGMDRIVGYLVSPYLINTIGPNLSAGRVQSAAVKICVDREREIETFVPEEYWPVYATLAKSSPGESFTAKLNKKIDSKNQAQKTVAQLEQDTFVISALDEKEKKRNPLPPLITSSLATSASGRFKFQTARSMKAAQTLYEAGLITYMRTDSFRVAADALEACRDWLGQNQHQIPKKPNVYANKGGAQDAHEAIRPTDVTRLPSTIFLAEDERKIYQLVWERFVASQMLPALYDTVSLTVKSSSGHLLKANGRMLKYKGWLEIAGQYEEEEDDNKLPLMKLGDSLLLVPPKVKTEQKFTQPPPRYSEKTLVMELERRGIGRPSTYASIMSKITDRGYVIRKGEAFQASETGKQVIDALAPYFKFVESSYTAQMEDQLTLVADGKIDYLSLMTTFYAPFAQQLKQAYTANNKDFGFKCETCQESMHLKHGNFGFYMACINYPECRTTFSCEMVDGKPIKTERAKPVVEGINCPTCQAGMFKKDGKFGPFYSCSTFPKCHGMRKVPYGKICVECGLELYMTILSGIRKLACMGYPNCRYLEDLPVQEQQEGWVDPRELAPPTIPKAVKKVIKQSKIESVQKVKS